MSLTYSIAKYTVLATIGLVTSLGIANAALTPLPYQVKVCLQGAPSGSLIKDGFYPALGLFPEPLGNQCVDFKWPQAETPNPGEKNTVKMPVGISGTITLPEGGGEVTCSPPGGMLYVPMVRQGDIYKATQHQYNIIVSGSSCTENYGPLKK